LRANKFEVSYFKCPECEKLFPLPRPRSKRREKGHVKDLWCPFCKKEVKTIEYRDMDVYKTLDGKEIAV